MKSFLYFLLISHSSAAVFTVDTIQDGLPDPSDGLTTLREAILAAEETPEFDTIIFDPVLVVSGPAMIELTQFDSGIDGGDEFTSEAGPTAFIIDGGMAIIGPAVPNSHGVIIRRADSTSNFRLFHIRSEASVVLQYLTLGGGHARGGNGHGDSGGGAGLGGCAFVMGSLEVSNCSIIENSATGGAGGSFLGSELVGGGGGMGEDGTLFLGGSPNSIPGEDGGFGGGGSGGGFHGGFGGGGGSSTGIAGDGGFGGGGGSSQAGGRNGGSGGFAGGNSRGPNGADSGGGGGGGCGGAFFVYPRGRLILDSCLLNENIASGGEPHTDNSLASGTLFLSEGGSSYGGAIFNLEGFVGVINCTLSSNNLRPAPLGTGDGTALYNLGGVVTCSSSTFANHIIPSSLSDGATIYSGDDSQAFLIMENTIVSNTENGVDVFVEPSSSSQGLSNLIQTHRNFSGGISTSANPLLSPLTDNGGIIPSMAIGFDSPAWNTGDNFAAGFIPTDSREEEFPRIVFGQVDIGAFELSPSRIIHVLPGLRENVNGISWETAFTDLQSALENALPGDSIWVASGTYLPGDQREATFSLPDQISVLGGFRGNETNLDQRNSDPLINGTILSGELDSSTHTYHVVNATGSRSFLSGFTIRGGLADGDPNDRNHVGGGITVDGFGDSVFANLLVTDNSATIAGGMYVNAASPRIIDSTFRRNTCSDNGAGVYLNNSSAICDRITVTDNVAGGLAGGMFLSGTPTVRNSLIVKNTCTGNGGGIHIHRNTTASLTNLTIVENSGRIGGGLWITQNRGFARLRNSILAHNTGGGDFADLAGITGGTLVDACNNLAASFPENLVGQFSVISNADPRFVGNGDYRLTTRSPALDTGDDSSILPDSLDLNRGTRRIGSAVDLGAHEAVEGGFVFFSTLYPGLHLTGDANRNGQSNYLDYALGGNPLGPFEAKVRPELNGNLFVYTARVNAADAFSQIEVSTDLASWQHLTEGVDFIKKPFRTSPIRETSTLQLNLPDEASRFFIRVGFSRTAKP